MMLGFTFEQVFQFRLPPGNNNESSQNITVQIRDRLNAVTEYNLESVVVVPNLTDVDEFINAIRNPTNIMNSNTFVRLLASHNENIVEQVTTTFSQIFNKLNMENRQKAIASKLYIFFISENSFIF